MGGTKRYVYGVIEAEPLDLDVDGVEGATTAYSIECGDHAAVVSDVDTLQPDRDDENFTAHDEVLRAVLTHDGGRTVVPMQFGMVFETERALENVLRSGRRAFTRSLREVQDMVELGVKVVADEGATVDREAVAAAVESELDPSSARVSEGDLFSDLLVANRSYLVERSERAAFDDAIDRLRDAHDDVTVQYTGPWAPYSFVDIEIGVEQ